MSIVVNCCQAKMPQKSDMRGESFMVSSTAGYKSVIFFLKLVTACLALIAFFSAPLSLQAANRLPQKNKKSGSSATAPATSPKKQDVEIRTSPVILDGKKLFRVQGFGASSSEARAGGIGERIRKVAEDLTIQGDSVTTVDTDIATHIVAGDNVIMSLIDRDAQLEGRTRQDLAWDYAGIIRRAIENYRVEYSRKSILTGALYAFLATVVFIVILVLIFRLFRRLNNLIETRYRDRIHAIHIKSIEVVQAERVRTFIHELVSILRFAVIAVVTYAYVHIVLSFFPWTRPFSYQLLGYLLVPLKVIGSGIVNQIPDLLFLAVLAVITRYALKFMHLFFNQIASGTITVKGFYPEWARPTDRLLSLLIIAFAVVVAFPYIPGSSSPAFKGVSLFIGVLFSLGSQSAVSNIIGGLVMTYRRAFHVGDRIQIGDITGDVTEIRLQLIHLRTVKNEDVTVPSSMILNTHLKNYSALAREKGLILHTAVTIGYDAPWRQVHALLLMAAGRTEGLLKEPAPFILQTSLDDFYVRYELNVYTDAPHNMAHLYSELHQNIQDCFNEYGVQIMSPHYESDPAAAKVVPKDKWYAPPAQAAENEDPSKG